MSDSIETIDRSRIEILSEFAVEYENDEETLAAHLATIKRVFIGSLDDFAVLASSAANGQMTPDLALDKSNFTVLTEMLDKCLKADFEGENGESLYVEAGADKLGVGINSNFPHTLTAPFERVYLINLRPIFLNEGDSLDQGYAGLKVPLKSALQLLAEMKNLLAEKRI
jgi:hypothetical protein